MPYRAEVISLEGFVQQIACCYLRHGYWFYVTGYIPLGKDLHAIDRKHFELALMLGDDVSVYWPKTVELSEKKVIISDYAKRSPEELFAEAFALNFVGKKLPQKLHDLLDKHMRTLVK